MGRDFGTALGFVCLMLMAPLSGCFGEEGVETLSSESLDVSPTIWTGGLFQTVSFEANGDLSVFIPYLIKNSATGFVSNSTVLNIEEGDVVELSVFNNTALDILSLLLFIIPSISTVGVTAD